MQQELGAWFIRATLSNVSEDAVTDGITLTAALKAFRRGRVQSTAEGYVVAATAGNGRQVAFHIPDNLSPVSLTKLGSYLEAKYSEAVTRLGGTPSDAQILAEMLDKIQPVTRFQSDFTCIAK